MAADRSLVAAVPRASASRRELMMNAPRPALRASDSKGTFGSGVRAINPRNAAAVPSTAGLEKSWPTTSRLKSVDDDDRVTISPAASEVKKAGIWLTSPSPIVSLVKTLTASPRLMP